MFQIKIVRESWEGWWVAKNWFAWKRLKKSSTQIIKKYSRNTSTMLLSILFMPCGLLYLNYPPFSHVDSTRNNKSTSSATSVLQGHHWSESSTPVNPTWNSPALNCLQDSPINRDGCVLCGELCACHNPTTRGSASIDLPRICKQSRRNCRHSPTSVTTLFQLLLLQWQLLCPHWRNAYVFYDHGNFHCSCHWC